MASTRLFEDAWVVRGKTYVREFDTTRDKSNVRQVSARAEYYLKDPNGRFTGLIDGESLKKEQGSAWEVEGAYGAKKGNYVYIRDTHFGQSSYNLSPRIWHLDIETKVGYNSVGFPVPEKALEEICLIQFWDTIAEKGYVYGLEEWHNELDYDYPFEVEYITCKNEIDLLQRFFRHFMNIDPFIITAWNGSGFDFPYFYKRLDNLSKVPGSGLSSDLMSNHGKTEQKIKQARHGKVSNIVTPGHKWIDLKDVYQKFVFDNVPNYSLDTIGEKETGIGKVDHTNYLKFDDFRIGNYLITGQESEEQKSSKLYKAAALLEQNPNHPKKDQLQSYIQKKSYSDFVDYGIRDFVLLKGIDDSQNLLSLMLNMSQKMGCLLDDTLGTLKAWDCYITNAIYEKGQIAPPRQDHEDPAVVGGFVREVIPGKYRWVLSSDVTSMYPLLGMAAHNMSPETFIEFENRPDDVKAINKLLGTQDEDAILAITEKQWAHIREVAQKHNVVFSVGGAVFSKDFQGIIPELVTTIYKERKTAKGLMFKYEQKVIDAKEAGDLPETYKEYQHLATIKDTEQMTAKISINSLYGAIAAKYFSLFNESIAQAITGNGRYFIKLLADKIENKCQSIVKSTKDYMMAGDTDSVYFQIEPIVDRYCSTKTTEETVDWCNNFYEKVIEPLVQETVDELAKNLNSYDKSYISADREIIADSALWIAKKRYAARVLDLEGKRYPTNDPYMKMQGLETIKGGTAPFSKKYLKQALPVILDLPKSGVLSWFDETKAKFIQSAEDNLDNIAKTAGVSKIHDPNWGKVLNGRKVAVPFGSRTCVVSNRYIQDNNLEDVFTPLAPGEKVKVLYLTLPNPLNSEAFAYNDTRFADKFKEYIDYDMTFSKHFMKPLEMMVNAAGVDIAKRTEELDIW